MPGQLLPPSYTQNRPESTGKPTSAQCVSPHNNLLWALCPTPLSLHRGHPQGSCVSACLGHGDGQAGKSSPQITSIHSSPITPLPWQLPWDFSNLGIFHTERGPLARLPSAVATAARTFPLQGCPEEPSPLEAQPELCRRGAGREGGQVAVRAQRVGGCALSQLPGAASLLGPAPGLSCLHLGKAPSNQASRAPGSGGYSPTDGTREPRESGSSRPRVGMGAGPSLLARSPRSLGKAWLSTFPHSSQSPDGTSGSPAGGLSELEGPVSTTACLKPGFILQLGLGYHLRC